MPSRSQKPPRLWVPSAPRGTSFAPFGIGMGPKCDRDEPREIPIDPRLAEVICIIIEEFDGDTGAFFDSLRSKELTIGDDEINRHARIAETLTKNL